MDLRPLLLLFQGRFGFGNALLDGGILAGFQVRKFLLRDYSVLSRLAHHLIRLARWAEAPGYLFLLSMPPAARNRQRIQLQRRRLGKEDFA
jgi:hypothetical protein